MAAMAASWRFFEKTPPNSGGVAGLGWRRHGRRGGYGGVAENGVPPAPHTRTQPHAHAAATTSGSDAPAQTAATSSGSDASVTNGGLQRGVLAEKTKLLSRRRRRRREEEEGVGFSFIFAV